MLRYHRNFSLTLPVGSDFPTRELIHIIHQHKHLNIMALELNDIMAMKGMGNGHDGFSPYEQMKLQHMESKKPSGTAIGALAVSVGAAVLAIGAGAWAGSRAQNAKEVAVAKHDGLRDLVITSTNNTNATLERIAHQLERETDARVSGDITLNATINDTVSGSQQGQLTASQIATNEATAQIVSGVMTGKYSENPTKVQIYSAPQPCACPGCGFNG